MSAPNAMNEADEVIERLAREYVAEALGDIVFLETTRKPRKLAGSYAVAALQRAAIMLQARLERERANG